jgi:hypothetical protein
MVISTASFAEHLTAEYRVKTQGRGRTVDEWKQRPERGDNHWFDCLVGCAAGASIQGAVLPNTSGSVPLVARERLSFADLQKEKEIMTEQARRAGERPRTSMPELRQPVPSSHLHEAILGKKSHSASRMPALQNIG